MVPFVPDEELLAELKAAFAIEAAELLESLNRELLALERSESPREKQLLLKEIFRAAHSLKGGAAVVGLSDVRTLAHELETIFASLQRDELGLRPSLFDVVYEALDVVQRLVTAGGDDPADHAEVTGLAERIAALVHPDDEPAAIPDGEAASTPDVVAAVPPAEPAEAPKPAESADVPEPLRAPATGLGGDTVRITTAKLDQLMAQVGELVVAAAGSQRTAAEVALMARELGDHVVRASPQTSVRTDEVSPDDGLALSSLLDRVETLRRWTAADARRIHQVTNGLQEDVRRARMLPVATVFETFPRMVRDLARSQGKNVRLDIRGGETDLDRAILEHIKAPLTHLLRNCVDHGIEDPETRVASGKRAEGIIVLSAIERGDMVSIEVADDGRGINVDQVKAIAVEKGAARAEEVAEMGRREVLGLIFRSGLSTSRFITSVSGRGVGLDVVRENVEALNGSIEVETDAGRGTKFSLVMPLTVATTRCVLVRSGNETFAVPLSHVVRTIRISPADVQEAEGSKALILPEGPLPLRDLASVLNLEAAPWENGRRHVLIARAAGRAAALAVDGVVGIEEAVVKKLPSPLLKVRHVAGVTILGTGEAVLVLNLADVVRTAVRSIEAAGPVARRAADGARSNAVKIVLADDSITTRTLEKNILQSAGYEVRVAVNGADAWRAIQEDMPDAVVSDVQMPVMDGFELTATIRADERCKDLPVILVTSLESEDDRERGMDVGADAYIGKSSFDQEQLLDAVRRLT